MKYTKYPSLARAAEALTKQGFLGRFTLEENCLKNQDGKVYHPEEVAIVTYYRFFPKDSNRNRISIIFALETNDGYLGLLVSSYNAYEKVDLLEFMDRVKIKAGRDQENAF